MTKPPAIAGRPHLAPAIDQLLAELPPRVDRRTAADLVSRYLFPVRPRTLERWPLATRRLNKRALIETAELFAVAQAMVEGAPLLRAGRAPLPKAA